MMRGAFGRTSRDLREATESSPMNCELTIVE